MTVYSHSTATRTSVGAASTGVANVGTDIAGTENVDIGTIGRRDATHQRAAAASDTSQTESEANPQADALLFSPQTWRQIAWLLVGLGIGVRLVRFLLRFPLWGDEHMLADNILKYGYAELAGGLDYVQVAPVLYLWSQLAVVQAFGTSELTLRLVALVGGIVALVLFRHLAGRLLSGPALALAVGFLAAAYFPIRHAAEVKPYATDLMATTLLLALAVEWLTHRDQSRWLWAMVVAVPLMLGLSYPVLFVVGGMSLALLWPVWQQGRRACVPYVFYNLSGAGTFALLYHTVIRSQMAASGTQMDRFWKDSFPPLGELSRLPLWLADVHTGEMLAYPVGGERGGSSLTLLCMLVGLVALWRGRRHRPVVVLTGGVFLIAFIAGALQRYPYGLSERMTQYLVPLICLAAGAGSFALWQAMPWASLRRRGPLIGVVSLAVVALGIGVYDLVKPYKYRYAWEHQGFARWFWNQPSGGEPMVCLEHDLHVELQPGADLSAYTTYRDIFSPRHQTWGAADYELPAGPVRCVSYTLEHRAHDEVRLQAWLDQMQQRYTLASEQSHRIIYNGVLDPTHGIYTVYRFVPKQQSTDTHSTATRPTTTNRH